MKVIIVALALVAIVAAAPASVPGEPIPIIRSDLAQNPDGSYKLDVETGDGIIRTETGELKEVLDEEKKPHVVVVVRGSYSYTNPDGKQEIINYSADENGFIAEGDSIPKPPSRR